MTLLEQFLPAYLEEVVGDRFGRYSKYIIQDRAIPDVRDGLKPVQRRILYAMYDAGNTPDKQYRKSAKTVGDVMGNYHPHGDSSIYEGMVRMAQPWKMGHPLIDGHGNWGSLDDDPAAAMRYTEARLSKIAIELLRDIDKRTVSFKDNFDNTTKEPTVLPARYPNLLVNGVSGISSGFATEIPTHNLREVIDACILLMEQPSTSLEQLMSIVRGPDFPGGGIVMGEDGIREAYTTGKGRIYIRSRAEIEDVRGGKQQIVITELPYQVVKSRLVTAMETIRIEKKVEGIAEVRDESGRNGLRIVVELKKDADASGVLAYLLKKTDLQTTYNFNMVAIVNKAPRQLGLKPMLEAYITHQKEVVTNRTQYDLEKALDRAHVLEGLAKALNLLDQIIETIKASKNRADAEQNLMTQFEFTERQADAILTLQLYRLTNLEITSIEKELRDVKMKILYFKAILNDDKKLIKVIKDEMTTVRDEFGIDRRSAIQSEVEELKVAIELTVPSEDVLVTLSHEGYVKRTSQLSFTRSGSDRSGSGVKEGDVIRHVLDVNTLDTLLIFTRLGQYYAVPVHTIPDFKWKDAGTAIVNVIGLAKDDSIVSVVPVRSFDEDKRTLLFVTASGQVKRSELAEYKTARANKASAAIKAGEEVVSVHVLEAATELDLMLVSLRGMAIRFSTDQVSLQGRTAGGVRGMQLAKDDAIVGSTVLTEALLQRGAVLVVTDAGYAKRTPLSEYPAQGRGGKGVQTFEFKLSGKSNGQALVGAVVGSKSDKVIAMSSQGAESVEFEKAMQQERKATGRAVFSAGLSDIFIIE